MASMFLFLLGWSAVILQFLSRNIWFVWLATTAILTLLSVNLCYKKNCWYWSVPSIFANGFLLYGSVQMHLKYGSQVNDFLIISIMLVLVIALTVVEILPRKEKVSRE